MPDGLCPAEQTKSCKMPDTHGRKEPMEENETEQFSAESEPDSSGWDEAWDDETPGGPDESAEPEDEPDAPAEEADLDTDEGKNDEKQDQFFTLKHLGQIRTVNRDELITLGQKGLDYDHVREERDDARGKAAQASSHEDFLRQMASEAGVTVDDLIDNARAQVLSRRSGIDAGRALDKVRYERQLCALRAQAGGAQTEADKARKAGFLEFARTRSDVKPGDIPREVWLRVRDGMSLPDAYAVYEAGKLRAENKALKASASTRAQNEKNTARTAGSRRTAGSASSGDDWAAFWDDGT
jgi:hypothetical protein